MTKKHTNKFVLLYSARYVEKIRQANRAINNDGKEVEYTKMVDQARFGKWETLSGWNDEIEVGYIDDYDQITYCSPMEFKETGDTMIDLALMLEHCHRAQNKPNKLDKIVNGVVDSNSFN